MQRTNLLHLCNMFFFIVLFIYLLIILARKLNRALRHDTPCHFVELLAKLCTMLVLFICSALAAEGLRGREAK
jgi:hypothetical protein